MDDHRLDAVASLGRDAEEPGDAGPTRPFATVVRLGRGGRSDTSTDIPFPLRGATAPAPGATSVALCDHQRVVAQGLAALLGGEPDIEVVGIASTVAELVEMTARCRPAVVVIDHDLPDGSCIDATRRLKEAHPGVHVVLLVGDCDLADLLGALEAGCSSIQTKRGQADELVRAVRDAILGDVVISASLIHQVVPGLTPMLTAVPAPASGPPSARPSSGGAPLTPRELEVLELLADGLSGSAIAERLYLSAHTVRNHIQRSLDKLGAHSRLEAVAMAVQEDLIRRPLPTARMRA